MSDIVFVLGAGASAHTGAPIMKEFFNVVCDLYDDELISAEDKEAFKLIIDAKADLERILAKVAFDLNNLETLFSLIEMGKLINIFPGNIPVDKLHGAIQRVIVRTIELRTECQYKPDNTDAYDLLAQDIVLLEEQKRSISSSILTFNYDVAIDLAIERRVAPIDYCLHEKQGGVLSDFKLLKLHGSFNWAKYKKDERGDVIPIPIKTFVEEYCPPSFDVKIVNPIDLSAEDVTKKTFQIDIGSRINKLKPHFYSGYDPSLLDAFPLIVPPTWSKTEYHKILQNVWAQAAREISTAKYIFVIGYSLPKSDLFFQYLLALGMLSISRIKSFWVVDVAEDTIKRFGEFLGDPIKGVFNSLGQRFDHFAMEHIHQFFEFNKLIPSGVGR
jgi:hypothetical protein